MKGIAAETPSLCYESLPRTTMYEALEPNPSTKSLWQGIQSHDLISLTN